MDKLLTMRSRRRRRNRRIAAAAAALAGKMGQMDIFLGELCFQLIFIFVAPPVKRRRR